MNTKNLRNKNIKGKAEAKGGSKNHLTLMQLLPRLKDSEKKYLVEWSFSLLSYEIFTKTIRGFLEKKSLQREILVYTNEPA